jgi:hypothetical protein
LEVEHIVSASTTIGSPLDGNHNSRNYRGMHTGLANTGDDDTVANQKAAVISCSKCTIARKLERGTTPARGTAEQGWGASAAPLPNIPLSAADELPPPLLDGGPGKINSTTGGDGGKCVTDDGLQWTVADDGDRVDDVWTRRDDKTAIKDRFDPNDASCKLNRVDPSKKDYTHTLQCGTTLG